MKRQKAPFQAGAEGTDAALAARNDGHTAIATAARYASLTKPGVLAGNVLTTLAGYLAGSHGHPDALELATVLVGTAMVIASATVLNNVLDRDIDQLMSRTRRRATVTGGVSTVGASTLSIALGIAGFAVLASGSGLLVVAVGAVGFLVYVVLYGALAKRRSMHGTLVGSVSGALPILGGYIAATGVLDVGGTLVFLAVFFWQMPEFYSIAVYRHDEYAAAGLPVMSVVKGIRYTIRRIQIYTVLFVVTTVLLGLADVTSVTATVALTALGVVWLLISAAGPGAADSIRWARSMFRFSLIMILALCAALCTAAVLP